MKYVTSLVFILLCLTTKAQLFRSYYPGCYYTLDGKRVVGLISSYPYSTTIYFKSDKGEKPVKLQIKDLKAVVNSGQSLDSLIVLSEDGVTDKSYLAAYIFKTPKTTFYHKLKRISTGGAPVMTTGVSSNPSARGSAPSFTNTYSWSTSPGYNGLKTILMYSDGTTTHCLTKSDFRKVGSALKVGDSGCL